MAIFKLTIFDNWCTPAYVYFIISIIFMTTIVIQNYYSYNNKIFCIGMYSCDVDNIYLLFTMKIIYILFWTWILNISCHYINPGLSWALLLFPVVLMLFLIRNIMT